uniref:Uncharacterized protein n=1 Tax=Panagrolaimus superbus TaxID=310955 RepID=A0A914YLN7_9BILA
MWFKISVLFLLCILSFAETSRNLRKSQQQKRLGDHGLMEGPFNDNDKVDKKQNGYDMKSDNGDEAEKGYDVGKYLMDIFDKSQRSNDNGGYGNHEVAVKKKGILHLVEITLGGPTK